MLLFYTILSFFIFLYGKYQMSSWYLVVVPTWICCSCRSRHRPSSAEGHSEPGRPLQEPGNHHRDFREGNHHREGNHQLVSTPHIHSAKSSRCPARTWTESSCSEDLELLGRLRVVGILVWMHLPRLNIEMESKHIRIISQTSTNQKAFAVSDGRRS